MSPIRIQLPKILLEELQNELQGTRSHESGGFVWYARSNGDAVYFMPDNYKDNINDRPTESDEQQPEPTTGSGWWGTVPTSRW